MKAGPAKPAAQEFVPPYLYRGAVQHQSRWHTSQPELRHLQRTGAVSDWQGYASQQ